MEPIKQPHNIHFLDVSLKGALNLLSPHTVFPDKFEVSKFNISISAPASTVVNAAISIFLPSQFPNVRFPVPSVFASRIMITNENTIFTTVGTIKNARLQKKEMKMVSWNVYFALRKKCKRERPWHKKFLNIFSVSKDKKYVEDEV